MAAHWGEYLVDSNKVSDSTNLLPPSNFQLSNYELTPDPSVISTPVINIKDEDKLSNEQTCVKGGMVGHTIQLEQYRSQIHVLINNAVQQLNDNVTGQAPVELKDSPLPPTCTNCCKQQSNSEEDKDLHDRDFVRGIGVAPPTITPSTCSHLLRKSMAQICLHQGYEECVPSALDALAGACQVFYTKLLTQLRHNVDMEAEHGYTGFQDSMHRTLAQVGQGDIKQLLSDYHDSTVVRHDKLLSKCADLHATYLQIKTTGEVPEHLMSVMSMHRRDSNPSIFSLSDNEEKSEVGSATVDADDGLGEDDDAQKLLELAGMSGFDITIQPETADGTVEEAADTPSSSAVESAKPKSKAKSRSKGSSASTKRRKKH